MHPFVVHREYGRQRLLQFLGSRQSRSGVLWGSQEPGCLICTSGGRHGTRAGYSDEELRDGNWWYFGQGRAGDQSLKNTTNAKLASGQKSILLFSAREPTAKEIVEQSGYGKAFAFRGSFNVSTYDFITPPTGPRQGNRLLRFHLIPADEGREIWEEDIEAGNWPVDLAVFQKRLKSLPQDAVPAGLSAREYRKRNAQVHAYARLRAAGRVLSV